MNPGDSVTFLVVLGDGTVKQTVQHILCAAPPFKGMKSYWTEQGVLVCVASRRYTTGIAVSGRWLRTGGLTIEKGDLFTETDARSEMAKFTRKLKNEHERRMRRWARASGEAA